MTAAPESTDAVIGTSDRPVPTHVAVPSATPKGRVPAMQSLTAAGITTDLLAAFAQLASAGIPAGPQLRGTSFQGTSRSTRGSPGRPRTRSPTMLRITSEVPPSIEFARARRNDRRTSAAPNESPVGRTRG